MSLDAFLLFVALVSFLLAAAGVPSRINWIGLGLAAWVASVIW